MTKLAAAASPDVIDKLAGVIDFYDWKGIHCARKWPVMRVKNRAQAVQDQYPAFRYINQLAGALPKYIVTQWRAMVPGTHLTWKDLLVRAYLAATYQPEGYPKTIPWAETQKHFCITAWHATPGMYYIHLELWTDTPCRLWLVRLESLPVRKVHSYKRRGNPNFKDIWFTWRAESLESPADLEDTTYHDLYLNKAIPHYTRGTFFAATQEALWMRSISQYFTPKDLLLT